MCRDATSTWHSSPLRGKKLFGPRETLNSKLMGIGCPPSMVGGAQAPRHRWRRSIQDARLPSHSQGYCSTERPGTWMEEISSQPILVPNKATPETLVLSNPLSFQKFSSVVEFTAHLPRFGGLTRCRVAGLKIRKFQPFSRVYNRIPRLYLGGPSHRIFKPATIPETQP